MDLHCMQRKMGLATYLEVVQSSSNFIAYFFHFCKQLMKPAVQHALPLFPLEITGWAHTQASIFPLFLASAWICIHSLVIWIYADGLRG